ncbi:hypothetical protein BaRGS_00007751 [Batillaria attramentaria]|uniref:Uncharacterized protein n=1 Tax=Batillaria attramentaria TaxID=370345 RepID=A0ABD0LNQ4_9CAEN
MKIRFDGKRALVTGAGKGIGRDIAKALHNCGADTVALSRTQADLDSLQQECPGIQTVTQDLSDWNKARHVLRGLGHVDLLVNNAGVGQLVSFLECTEELLDTSFGINFKGLFNVSQVVAKEMVERKTGGAIVNISGLGSLMAFDQCVVNCTTKAAVDSLTRVMALELGPHKIRVNSVCPTLVKTERARPAWSSPMIAGSLLAWIPLGEFPDPEDVTNAVLFLLSDKAAMINGTSLPIDGGQLAC